MPSVSVVIPCYNCAAHIADAVASVRAQTLRPLEIIVVDDRSTDDTLAVASELGVTVLQTPRNSGSGATRNVGVEHARGDLVAFIDADDTWDAHHLATVVPLLERFPEAVLAFTRVRLIGERTGEWRKPIPPFVPTFVLWESLQGAIAPIMAVVIPRAALKEVGGFDGTLRGSEDFDLFFRLARIGPFVCDHAITANYRQHAVQLTKNRRVLRQNSWRARRGNWEKWGSSSEPETRARFEAVLLRSWGIHLFEAWRDGDPEEFAELLSNGSWLPNSSDIHARWRRRGRLLWAIRAWRRLPQGVRSAFRWPRPSFPDPRKNAA